MAALKAMDIDGGNDWKNMVAQQAPPTPAEAMEGGRAAERGQPATANPYPEGTQQHTDWAWGHMETEQWITWRADIAAIPTDLRNEL